MFSVVCAALSLLTVQAHPREAFAEKILSLPTPASKGAILRTLGKPDAIYTPANPDPYSLSPSREMWAYGLDGPASFPTLGHIVFNENGDVSNLLRYRSFAWEQVPEAQIRKGMRIWQKWWTFGYDEFGNASPELAAIQIANELRPLGKDAILASLDELCATYGDEAFNLIPRHEAVLKLLFSIDTEAASKDVDEAIKWGLRVEGQSFVFEGIPFTLFRGGGGSGIPPTAALLIPLIQKYGKFQATATIPTPDPLGWMSRLTNSKEWLAILKGYNAQPGDSTDLRLRHNLTVATRNMLVSLVPMTNDELQGNSESPASLKSLEGERLQWDSRRMIYVDSKGAFKQDCTLRAPVVKSISPEELARDDVYFVFRRLSSDFVVATLVPSKLEKPTAFSARIEGLGSSPVLLVDGTQDGLKGQQPTSHPMSGDSATMLVRTGTKLRLLVRTGSGKETSYTVDVSYPQ